MFRPNSLSTDKIFVNGRPSPGICELEKASLKWRLDVRKMWGMIGGTVLWTGKELAEFTFYLHLSSDQDWDDWDAWKGPILAKPVASASQVTPAMMVSKALSLQHPVLEEVGITAGIVQEVTLPGRPDQTGLWTIQIDMLAFYGVPKIVAAKAEAAKATEVDPVERDEIAPLLKEVENEWAK